MATVWLTYAWEDNRTKDVDFVAQEILASGLSVKLDRWNIGAGKRLWQQVENFIQDPSECDAWILFATPNSLGSEACKEEFAYALDRALNQRGPTFPVIGLFTSSVDDNLIPAGIRTRLYVTTQDPDWKERIKAAAENRLPGISHPQLEPYFIKISKNQFTFIIEVRPRAGTWAPFTCGVPASEKEAVKPHVMHAPSGGFRPGGFVHHMPFEGPSKDGKMWMVGAGNEATPSQSYYIHCESLPSLLMFGVEGRKPQYYVEPNLLPIEYVLIDVNR